MDKFGTAFLTPLVLSAWSNTNQEQTETNMAVRLLPKTRLSRGSHVIAFSLNSIFLAHQRLRTESASLPETC